MLIGSRQLVVCDVNDRDFRWCWIGSCVYLFC